MNEYNSFRRLRPIRVIIRRRFPFLPSASAWTPRGNLFVVHGVTRRQAKRRLLTLIGAVPAWPESYLSLRRPSIDMYEENEV